MGCCTLSCAVSPYPHFTRRMVLISQVQWGKIWHLLKQVREQKCHLDYSLNWYIPDIYSFFSRSTDKSLVDTYSYFKLDRKQVIKPTVWQIIPSYFGFWRFSVWWLFWGGGLFGFFVCLFFKLKNLCFVLPFNKCNMIPQFLNGHVPIKMPCA